jgi:hypothetical protein
MADGKWQMAKRRKQPLTADERGFSRIGEKRIKKSVQIRVHLRKSAVSFSLRFCHLTFAICHLHAAL